MLDTPVTVPSASPTALPCASYECEITSWLLTEGRFAPDVPALLAAFADRALAAGIPLHRCSMVLQTLHPTIYAAVYVWKAGATDVAVVNRDEGMARHDLYTSSPFKRVVDGAPGIRRRLIDPTCPQDFGILPDLIADGVTDYLVLPLVFSNRSRYAVTFATRAPDGFGDEQLDRLASLMHPFASLVEILSVRRIATNLMDTYLGRQTGRRVLDGMISRGSSATIAAAIWYSDLEGFTRMADRLPPAATIGALNDHFEAVVEALHAHGGEPLKFMGDGLLAIFPTATLGADAAAAAALAAYDEAHARTAARNAERAERGLPALDFWTALHLGEVSYGNIGAPERLDFTVIGPAVNHAARMETQCRVMGRRVITSATFAAVAPRPLLSLGFHALRGVGEAQELFTLP